jgi:energy-coupling factor transporter ATP-binding protein EcfA2
VKIVETVGVFLPPVSAGKENPKNEEITVPVPGSDTAELLTQTGYTNIEEHLMPQEYTFDAFRDAMSADGQLVRFKDPLNKKMSLSENIYRETATGLVKFSDFHNNGEDYLEKYKLSHSAREGEIQRLAHEITVEGEPDAEIPYLVAMPDGKVIDFEALAAVMGETRAEEIDKYQDRWIKPISQYRDRYIILRTGATYNGKIIEGSQILKDFLSLVLDPMDVPFGAGINPLEELMSWIILFMGRLLIGGNVGKEYVVFLGEKNSGKTTFVNLLMDIVGDYAGSINGDILYSKHSYQEQTLKTLCRMKSLRFLLHSEGSNYEKINTANLKRITGDSKIPFSDGRSFIVDGTLVEETNYAPYPDNLLDEAFENRVVIIPFKKNTQVPVTVINKAIQRLNDHADAIFSLMVWSAAKGILKNAESNKAVISQRAQSLISLFREPVKAFFEDKCDPHATKDQEVKAEELFNIYGEWFYRFRLYYAARFPFLRGEIGLAANKLKQITPTAFNKEFWSIHRHMKKGSKGTVFFSLSIKNDYTPPNPEKAILVDRINHLDAASDQYESIEKEQRQTESLRYDLTRKEAKVQRQSQRYQAPTYTRNRAMMNPAPVYQGYPNSFRGPAPASWEQPPPSPPPSRPLPWSHKKVENPEPKPELNTIVAAGTCQSDDPNEYQRKQQAIMDSDGPYRPTSPAAMAYYDEYGEYPDTHSINPWGDVTRTAEWEAYVDAYLLRGTHK